MLGPRGGSVIESAIIVAAVVIGIIGGLIWLLRRPPSESARWRAFLERRPLSAAQRELIAHLSVQSGLTVLAIATDIATFERATALELKRHVAPLTLDATDIFTRIRQLRQALDYESRAWRAPLLTTRELHVGTTVHLFDITPAVARITEAHFVLKCPIDPHVEIGALVALLFVADRPVPYTGNCRVLAVEEKDGATWITLGHDEKPERCQRRQHARAVVTGPVRIEPVVTRIDQRGMARRLKGFLRNVSAGGVALESTTAIDKETSIMLSFELEGTSFDEIRGTVLECEPEKGHFRLRVEFEELDPREEDRLAAAVARTSGGPLRKKGPA